MGKIETPWSQEQVNNLNDYQQKGCFHPYTCDRKAPECEVDKGPIETKDPSKDGVLIATQDGWVCPCGKYKQNWAQK